MRRAYCWDVARRTGDDRIATFPNFFSLGRLACVPVFLWLLFSRDNRHAAAWLLAVLGCTDWVDGWIARRFDQGSDLGKIIDPVADRILLGVGVGAILIDGSVPVWVGVLVVAREVLVSIATLVIAAMGAKRIDVQWVGKAGTFGCMVAFPLFLVSHSTAGWAKTGGFFGWIVVVPALLFSYYAAATYVPIAKRALADGRSERATVPRSPPVVR